MTGLKHATSTCGGRQGHKRTKEKPPEGSLRFLDFDVA
jgi:hypothetical protein